MASRERCCFLAGISYALPEHLLNNDELAAAYPGWSAARIHEKTGISTRHIAAPEETASDLAVRAAHVLLEETQTDKVEIDFLLFCTQTPDHILPTTACLIQSRLELPTSCGALDFNLGCSGYIYGLGLAKGLIESGQASRLLLLTGDTYSKLIHAADKSVRTIFGDGASATLITAQPQQSLVGPFLYGTDGHGAANLMVPAGGMREAQDTNAVPALDDSGNQRTRNNLFMNGAEIFHFTLQAVPQAIASLLAQAEIAMADIDLFVFHQANRFMLEHLRRKLCIPAHKFVIEMEDIGNTVSSSIPIALRRAAASGQLSPGALVMLVGYGVGYSWGATLVRWPLAAGARASQ